MKILNSSNTLQFSFLICTSLAVISPFSSAEEIEKIVVTESRTAQQLTNISRSIALVDSDLIEQTQAAHIQQVLNKVAGVNIHRNSGQEMLIAVRSPVLSGAGACGSFLTLENGIAIRPNGFCNVNELFESHFELAQSIEIIKGPTSSFYGSNGLHGAINVISSASLESTPFIKTTFGEWDYQQLSFLANQDNFSISSSLSHDGGYRDNSGVDQQKLSLTHKTEFNNIELDTFITATNLNQETAGYLVGFNSYQDEALSRTNPNPEAYRDASSVRISQQYSFNSGLLLKPFVRYSEMEFLQHFVPGQPVEKNKHHSFGLQSQYQFQLSNSTLVDLGFDGEFTDLSLLEEQEEPTQGSAFLVATIPVGKHYDYQVDVTTLASFAHIQHKLSPKWQANLGLRIENIHFDYNNKMNSGRVDENGNPCGFGGCRFNRPESRTDDFTVASPKLGLVYTANENSHGYLNLSHGFRAPQATELYRLQREQEVSDLDPEQLIALDGGWSTSIDQLELSIEAYWYDKSDVILRDNDFFYVSNGETEHKGVELSFSQAITHRLSVDGNFSYSKHSYSNNPNLSEDNIVGNDIVSAPRRLANLSAQYQFDKWQLQLHSQFVDDYYLNPENTAKYKGHTLLNAHMRYQYSNALSLAINVDNLLDRRYAERANYTSFTQERYFPGKPRNVKVAMKYEF